MLNKEELKLQSKAQVYLGVLKDSNLGVPGSGEDMKRTLGKKEKASAYTGKTPQITTKETFPDGCLTCDD